MYALRPYSAVLDRTGGLVPEFVNPKYADGDRSVFARPARLECMMQDHSRMVQPRARVSFTQFPAWTYMPCKNSVAEAKKSFDAGLPLHCASASEMSQYEGAARDGGHPV